MNICILSPIDKFYDEGERLEVRLDRCRHAINQFDISVEEGIASFVNPADYRDYLQGKYYTYDVKLPDRGHYTLYVKAWEGDYILITQNFYLKYVADDTQRLDFATGAWSHQHRRDEE